MAQNVPKLNIKKALQWNGALEAPDVGRTTLLKLHQRISKKIFDADMGRASLPELHQYHKK